MKLNASFPNCIPIVQNLYLDHSLRNGKLIKSKRFITFLQNVKESIRLSRLQDLEDLTLVSSLSLEELGENKEVHINFCNNITDFSPLRHVNRVTIADCEGFTDSLQLDHVAHVTIGFCDRLEDVSGLRNAESVDLFDCPRIKSVEILKDVKNLKVSNCELLER